MNIIKRLPPQITNKIAAGEVVERPASVIKELVENSIDAGSTKIEIHIVEGGKTRIQIVDNGFGMSGDDAAASLERFSTSKINEFDDLEKLYSFGFRGEALASIASVSILEMKTKTESESEGVILRSEGGDIKSVKSLPRNNGTSITVSSLFFNTPARRKFQKNALSETRQIYRVFRYFALSYPDIYLSLYNDDKCVWNLKPGSLKQRISDLFDSSVSKNIVEVSYKDSMFSVFGYVSLSDWTRSTRSDQYLFVNKRFIKNKTAEHGVYQGYGPALTQNSGHPFFVLMLELAPDLFDINIHPSKLEARFQDERGLHQFMSRAIRIAIGAPELKLPAENIEKDFTISKSGSDQSNAGSQEYTFRKGAPVQSTGLISKKAHTYPEKTVHKPTESIDKEVEQKIQQPAFDSDKVWQVHRCFIFSQVKSGLIIIDQHVAHERVLYEKALKRMNTGEKASQQLLFPQTINLNLDELVIVNEIMPQLNKLGFQVKLSGDESVTIEAVPTEVKITRETEVFKNIIEEFKKNEYKDLSINERLAISYACRSAIMKGDKLKPDEMYRLIDDLFATEFPYYCPHGRPTVIDMSIKEINSRFLR